MRGVLLVLMIVGVLAGTTAAQPAGSAAGSAPEPAAGSASVPDPAAGSAAAGSGSAAADPTPLPPPALPDTTGTAELRKTCVAAMNADPTFAESIVKTADANAAKQRDRDTVLAHETAHAHVQKNQRHVIISYAAMWVIAALFVMFLWRRQQALKGEIAQLRRDLDAASKEGT